MLQSHSRIYIKWQEESDSKQQFLHASSCFLFLMMAASGCRHVAKLLKLVHKIGPAGLGDVDVPVQIQRCVRRVQQLPSSDFKDLARSMAELRCKDETSWQQLGSVVKDRVEEIKLAELVRIAGSFRVASQHNQEMLTAISARIKEWPGIVSCWSWADFILSLQRANMKVDGQLLEAATNSLVKDVQAVKKLNTFDIMSLVDASLNAGVFHQGMFRALSGVLVNHMDSLNHTDLSRIALAWGQAAYKDEPLVEALCKALHQNLSSFPKKRISWTLHGLSFVNCKDKELLTKLAVAWATAGSAKPVEVVHVVSALDRMGMLDRSLCDQIAACSLHHVPDLNARSISKILWICSQSGCTHVEFLEALGKAASQKILELSAKDLCEVSFAGAQLSLAPTLGSCIPAAAVEQVSAFSGSQLAVMMYSISRLSDKPGEYLPLLESAAFGHVSTLNSMDLRFIAMAWSRAGAGDPRLMEAVASRAVEVIDSLEPSAASHLAWAYSRLSVTSVNLFEALGQRCADTVSSFQNPQLAYTALAFVQSNVHDKMALVSIAAEALRRLRKFGNMYPLRVSLLSRAFIQADLESASISDLLEELAHHARQKGWTQLQPKHLDERTDFQKQCAEVVREFLPSVMVSRRHQMGPVLALALEQSNRIPLNLEVDTVDQELSNLDVVVRSRRDEFLETLGVEVLRFKVKDLNDLRYDLQQIFGESAEPTDLQGPDLGAQDESEAPTLHQSLWKEMEPGNSQSHNFL